MIINKLRQILPDNFFLRTWYSYVKAVLAAVYYSFPARQLKIIGITGTDGKTTTTEMLWHILQQNGFKTAKISSANFAIGTKEWKNKTKRTTVSPFTMQKFLHDCVQQKIEYVVLEVSSHALAQGRIWGIKFDMAILTNIAHEHLDFHRTMAHLQATKKLLFTKYLRSEGIAILNNADESGAQWSKELPIVETYSTGEDFKESQKGISFTWQKQHFTLPINGRFNMFNALASIAASQKTGLSLKQIAKALAGFSGVQGRMERIDAGQNFQVFVDFALTPQAFEQVCSSMKAAAQNKRLLLVFGATGSHDQAKRRPIGQVSDKYADLIFLTDDETYYENASKIRQKVAKNIKNKQKLNEISDRREAIKKALQEAKKGDIVLICGMGSLESRNMKGIEVPWSDVEVTREILEKEL